MGSYYPPQGKGLGRMAKRAKDFAASPDLRETMAKAAVMDDPTIYFLESV